jgi:hypothetical protein
VSRGDEAPRGFVVGRLLDGFDKEIARSAALGGRLLNERKIPVRPWTIRENGIIPDSDAASLRRCPMTALYIASRLSSPWGTSECRGRLLERGCACLPLSPCAGLPVAKAHEPLSQLGIVSTRQRESQLPRERHLSAE